MKRLLIHVNSVNIVPPLAPSLAEAETLVIVGAACGPGSAGSAGAAVGGTGVAAETGPPPLAEEDPCDPASPLSMPFVVEFCCSALVASPTVPFCVQRLLRFCLP